MKTSTGHVIGATYHSNYWGFDYKVLGTSEKYDGAGVTVQIIAAGPANDGTLFDKDVGKINEHLTPVGNDPIIKKKDWREPLPT